MKVKKPMKFDIQKVSFFFFFEEKGLFTEKNFDEKEDYFETKFPKFKCQLNTRFTCFE